MNRALLACAALALTVLPAGARAHVVFFNHGYVNVAPATYEAIRMSPFVIEELGAAENRTVAGSNGKPGWSGFYLYGERTYLEFFPASSDDPLGKIGLGMSIDDRQMLPAVAKRLSASAGVPFEIGKQTRHLNGVEFDWFDATGPDYGAASTPLLDRWVMAVYPTYLRNRYPDLTAAQDGVTREKVLARQYRPNRLLKNVTGVALVLTASERRRLLKELEGAGYAVRRRGASDEARGPEFHFSLSTVDARTPRSITYFLALNRRVAPRSLSLGASTLTLRPDATASWHFPAEGELSK